MATINTLKRVQGTSSVAGTTVYTVPVSTTVTIKGFRLTNNDPSNSHTFSVTVNGSYVAGDETPLPVGSAIDIVSGNILILEAGDSIVVYSDTDSVVDVHISYLEQVTS